MQTSYFARSGREPNAVSIALRHPKGWEGREYKKLAPTPRMVYGGIPEKEYVELYREILDKLSPRAVYQELGEQAILLCWERPGEFCHRRLVASWLEVELGVRVPELGERTEQKKLAFF